MFTEKEVNWTMAFSAINEDKLCNIRGINSRLFRDLKPRFVACKKVKKIILNKCWEENPIPTKGRARKM